MVNLLTNSLQHAKWRRRIRFLTPETGLHLHGVLGEYLRMNSTPKQLDFGDRTDSPFRSRPRLYFYAAATMALLAAFATNVDALFAGQQEIESIPGDLTRVIELSEIFAHGFGMFVIAVGIWLMVPDKRRFLPRIACFAVIPSTLIQFLKLFFSRSRPISYMQNDWTFEVPDNVSETWHGWMPGGQWNVDYATQSFPSAHTAVACGLAIGLSSVFPKGRWLFFSMALLASIQRITSMAHWTSDVCVALPSHFWWRAWFRIPAASDLGWTSSNVVPWLSAICPRLLSRALRRTIGKSRNGDLVSRSFPVQHLSVTSGHLIVAKSTRSP